MIVPSSGGMQNSTTLVVLLIIIFVLYLTVDTVLPVTDTESVCRYSTCAIGSQHSGYQYHHL